MFEYCADPSLLTGWAWTSCYLTTNTHFSFYMSFITVLVMLLVTAPIALTLGFGGAVARRSESLPIRWFGKTYTNMVRGVPELVFYLFVPIALDQGFEYVRHLMFCEGGGPVYQGNDFVVCDAAKLPLKSASETIHYLYNFFIAIIAFSIVFGAFAANVLDGALRAIPKGQLEAGRAYGMTDRQVFWRVQVPQMWTYALPGLSNLWMILIKVTPFLFLLGIQDIVYWASFLGATKTSAFYEYPHPDWRVWYFLAVLVFYLFMTWGSEKVLARITAWANRGKATLGSAAHVGGH